jgi:hypothetical protein
MPCEMRVSNVNSAEEHDRTSRLCNRVIAYQFYEYRKFHFFLQSAGFLICKINHASLTPQMMFK